MKKYLLYAVLLLLISCNKSPTGPDDDPLRNADLRKLQWTVDTLYTENSMNTVMYSIWGASENDIWVGGFNDNQYGHRWHYDGKKWTADWYGGIPGLEVNDFLGFASDDIWAVGARRRSPNTQVPNHDEYISLILHYDGSEWREVAHEPGRPLFDIGGRSPTELYAGGLDGTLFKYDGQSWTLDSIYIPIELNDSSHSFLSEITYDPGGDVYLLQNVNPNYQVISWPYLFKREAGKWVLKDSSTYWYYFTDLWISPQKNLYLTGSEVVTWDEGSGFTSLSVQLPTFRSKSIVGWQDNMLVCGRDGPTGLPQLFHYNGSDWAQIQSLPHDGVTFNRLFLVDRTVFMTAITNNYPIKSLIFKGTLRK